MEQHKIIKALPSPIQTKERIVIKSKLNQQRDLDVQQHNSLKGEIPQLKFGMTDVHKIEPDSAGIIFINEANQNSIFNLHCNDVFGGLSYYVLEYNGETVRIFVENLTSELRDVRMSFLNF